MTSDVERGHPSNTDVARDAVVALLIVAWTVLWASWQWSPSGISWHFFADGTHALVHTSGLHLYARQPKLQIGPLTFVVTALVTWLPAHTARVVAQILATAAGPFILLSLAPLVARERRRTRVLLGALVVIPAWTVLSVRWAHVDDVLAIVFTVAALRAVLAGRAIWAGLAIAAAVVSKPWAIGFLPLLLVLNRNRLAAFAAAGTAVVAVWAPFLIADGQTARALRPRVLVSTSSGLYALGIRAKFVPAWGRTAQLLAAPFAGTILVLRGRWPGLFIAAFAVRLALDPQNAPYYIGAAAVAAVIFDLLATRWILPWTTIVTVLVLWQPFVSDYQHALQIAHGWSLWWFTHPTTVGIIHNAWALVTVAFVVFAPEQWLTGRLRAQSVNPV